MDFKDSGPEIQQARARALSRLTALQRMRDDAVANGRDAMLRNIEVMIAAELGALRALRHSNAEPRA